LPSKDELTAIYDNRTTIDAVAIANGGSAFLNGPHWSSTEFDANYAWLQLFFNSLSQLNSKSDAYYVRAVRAF